MDTNTKTTFDDLLDLLRSCLAEQFPATPESATSGKTPPPPPDQVAPVHSRSRLLHETLIPPQPPRASTLPRPRRPIPSINTRNRGFMLSPNFFPLQSDSVSAKFSVPTPQEAKRFAVTGAGLNVRPRPLSPAQQTAFPLQPATHLAKKP